jgi:hypothetical protein
MRLLTIVVKDPNQVDIVREELRKLGVQEMTTFEPRSIADAGASGSAITVGLRKLLSGLSDDGTVIMGLVKGETVQGSLVNHLRSLGVDLSVPDNGYAFAMPIEWSTVGCAEPSARKR